MRTIKTMITVDKKEEKLSAAPEGYRHWCKKEVKFLIKFLKETKMIEVLFEIDRTKEHSSVLKRAIAICQVGFL